MAEIIGRLYEKEELMQLYRSGKSEFVAVYGRRRVGKTYLIRETFRDKMTFYHTGLSPFDSEKKVTKKDQLQHFYRSLQQYGMSESACPENWLQAFYMLEDLLSDLDDGSRQVVFIDELPWMDSARSGFLTAFEAFWNGWGAGRDNLLLIVCGSATSWMQDNLCNNKGGLYDRLTYEIKLSPFTLRECEMFFNSRQVEISRYDMVQAYMAFGGVPYYLGFFKKGLSFAQNVDLMAFSKNAKLKLEFQRLFGSLFINSEDYVKVVKLLSTKHCGFSRDDIAAGIGMKSGSQLTKILSALEASDFIVHYKPIDANRGETLYRLVDPFCLFYLKFMDNVAETEVRFWQNNLNAPSLNVWRGLSFEDVCMSHIEQIKVKLGISGIASLQTTWTLRADENHDGTQMDLIIIRSDNVVNLCEIKFSQNEFAIDKDYDRILRRRISALQEKLRKTQNVHTTFVTTFGVKYNAYSGIVQKEIVMDDLFV